MKLIIVEFKTGELLSYSNYFSNNELNLNASENEKKNVRMSLPDIAHKAAQVILFGKPGDQDTPH